MQFYRLAVVLTVMLVLPVIESPVNPTYSSTALAQSINEADLWSLVRDTADPLILRRFLERFPDGKFAKDATAKLMALEAEGEDDILLAPPATAGFALNAQRSLGSMNDCDRLAADPFDITNPPGYAGIFNFYLDARLAVPACRRAAAESDDPRYDYLLANALYYGWSDENRAEALVLLEGANSVGYAAAPRLLADFIRPTEPRSLEGPLYKRWQELLRRSFELGDPFAMLVLAGADADRDWNYEARGGQDVAMISEAYPLLESLSNAGMPRATTLVGVFHYPGVADGLGLRNDEGLACDMIAISMQAGDLEAIHRFFSSLGSSVCTSKGETWQHQWTDLWEAKVRSLANEGNTQAMSRLAMRASPGEALMWHERVAALRPLSSAKYSLAIYTYGRAGTGYTDYPKAARYAYELLENGDDYLRKALLEPDPLSPLDPELVRELQRLLKQEGYYSGSADGQVGPGTRAAIALVFATRLPPPL
jgi:hypothetical protein